MFSGCACTAPNNMTSLWKLFNLVGEIESAMSIAIAGTSWRLCGCVDEPALVITSGLHVDAMRMTMPREKCFDIFHFLVLWRSIFNQKSVDRSHTCFDDIVGAH